jgi:hypothetical protein
MVQPGRKGAGVERKTSSTLTTVTQNGMVVVVVCVWGGRLEQGWRWSVKDGRSGVYRLTTEDGTRWWSRPPTPHASVYQLYPPCYTFMGITNTAQSRKRSGRGRASPHDLAWQRSLQFAVHKFEPLSASSCRLTLPLPWLALRGPKQGSSTHGHVQLMTPSYTEAAECRG